MRMNRHMEIAWRDFITWAISEPKLREMFSAATGFRLPEQTVSPIEALVDGATGYRDHAVFEFARWVTETQFGMEYAPAAFRAACKEQ